ncbi:MAG: BON domain-containing protein [Amphiplicatus sp.]
MRSDEEIRDDILAEIDWDPRIESTDVGVTVKDGAVSLMGTVNTYAEKIAAEEAAKRVKGVRAIAEEIKVKLPSSDKTTDEEIAKRIAHILQWNTSIPGDDIKAEVRSGFVTLTGDVDWNYQREYAKTLVSGVRGVSAVSNMIKVKTRVLAGDVTREITRALHRNADVEASKVKFDVAGGRVTLRGDVKAWYERKLVEDAVWAAPGVTDVVDNLRVA